MREHQIVITLKPEQFQEVQRLARAAGNKSMGVFVRQQLLVALGLERNEKDGPASADGRSDPDWKHIAGELRRLHRELQVFISESLCDDYSQMVEEAAHLDDVPPVDEGVLTGSMLLEGLPVAGEQDWDVDEELIAAQERYQDEPPALYEEPAPELMHDVRDEMEELAERAFAISPRLGAIEMAEDKPPRTFSDPLGDLLETTLLSAAEENASAALNELLDEQLAQDEQHEGAPAAARIAEDMVSDAVGDPALTWDKGMVDFSEEDEPSHQQLQQLGPSHVSDEEEALRSDEHGVTAQSDENAQAASQSDDEESPPRKQDDKPPPPFTGPPPKKRR